MEIQQQIPRTYYLYGYGKAVDEYIPMQVTTGGTIMLVPPLGELELDYFMIVNTNTVTIPLEIFDGSTIIYKTNMNPSSTLVIQYPEKLFFLQEIVLYTGGNLVIIYGNGKVYLPPSF